MADLKTISKELCPGNHVRIGRNQSCELVIPCPYISSVHCAVEVEKARKLSSHDNSDLLKCSVQDLSSNGTWVLKGDEEGRSSKPVKLSKGTKVDLCPGDCILLLAPHHKLCAQYKFMLQYNVAAEDVGDGKLVLVQMPQASETLTTEPPTKNLSSNSEMYSMLGAFIAVASLEGGLHVAKKKAAYEPVDGELECYRDSSDHKSHRLETTTISPDHSSSSAEEIEVGVKRKIQSTDDSTEMIKRKKIACEELSSRSAVKGASLEIKAGPNVIATLVPSLTREVSKERCPRCLKLFPIVELPTHCAICQKTTANNSSANETHITEEERNLDTTDGVTKVESVVSEAYPIPLLRTEMSMEQCPHCSKIFPVLGLVAHAEVCTRESNRVVIDLDPEVEPQHVTLSGVSSCSSLRSMPTTEVYMEECPSCSKLFTLCELVDHSKVCRSHRNDKAETIWGAKPVAVIKSSRYSLESYSDSAIAASVSVTETSSVVVGKEVKTKEDSASAHMGAAVCAGGDDLEQCVYCLQDFPVTELINHVNNCPSKDMRNKVSLHKGIAES